MKIFLIPVLSCGLLSVSPLLADIPAAPGTSQEAPVPPPAAMARDTIPSADSLINQAFSLLINLQETLAAVQDKESADKAAKTLEGIQKDMQRFEDLMDKLSDAEQEKAQALLEKMDKRVERLERGCKQEGERLVKADFYHSASLKNVISNSDDLSEWIEPDEEEAAPAAAESEQDSGE